MNKLVNKNSSDRFIPLRLDQTIEISYEENYEELDLNLNSSFTNLAKIHYNKTNYRNTLKSILFPIETKILNFHIPKPFNPNKKTNNPSTSWPCNQRKKPTIGPPDIILDMPGFDSHIAHHIADWSRKNCIANIHEGEVHLFDPISNFRNEIHTGKRAYSCLKWHQSATKLAVGLHPNRFGILDISLKKILYEKICCEKFCDIFTFEWINNNLLASGCSFGWIRLYNFQLKKLNKIRAARKSIIYIVSSCDGKYLASGSMEKNIKLWKIPTLELLGIIHSSNYVKALAWHPWKASILAIGHTTSKEITIWNINTFTIIKTQTIIHKNASIDALTFNPISAELVLSYFIKPDNNNGFAIISVLTDLNEIVEELYIHTGPVRYLMWGNNNYFLATAGGDERLCIWKFFADPPPITVKLNKNKTLLDEIENFLIFN